MSDDRRVLQVCLWCGPLMALIFGIGFFPLAQFVPPPSPDLSAAELVRWFDDNLTGIRIGTIVMMAGIPLIGLWGIALAALTYRSERERGFPVITALQVMSSGIVVFTIVLFTTIWTVASFRVGETSAETTQALNDLAYFLLIFDFSPFCLWVLSFAAAIFRDRSSEPVFPRWVAYLNLWVITLSLPGVLIVFFKDGAFSYEGVVGFYFVVVVFFVWLIVMTTVGLKAATRGAD